MNRSEAQKMVEDNVLSKLEGCSVMIDKTIEYDFGWAFFYQSITYINSKDFRDMIVGHGPVIVDKNTKQIYETGSAHSTEDYVSAYLASGNPLAEPTSYVQVCGWKDGANSVATIKFIREVSELGLKDSKNIIDRALNNLTTSFKVSSISQAEEAVKIINENNFVCKQLWSNQC